MREWRKTHPPDKAKQSEYDKKKWAAKSGDKVWREQQRTRLRLTQRRLRKDPAVRKRETIKHKKWVEKNRDKIRDVNRRYAQKPEYRLRAKQRLLRKYGLTYEEYEAKITANDGKCPICLEVIAVKPCVDHNHETGQVRDVLCNRCNQWIGFVETRRELVAPMLAYLDKWDRIIKQMS